MTNAEMIQKFNNGGKSGKYSHLEIVGDNLYNYNTIIARRVNDGNLCGIELNVRKYSRTTSKIQNQIRQLCNIVGEFVGEPVRYYW